MSASNCGSPKRFHQSDAGHAAGESLAPASERSAESEFGSPGLERGASPA